MFDLSVYKAVKCGRRVHPAGRDYLRIYKMKKRTILTKKQRKYMNSDPFYEFCIHENIPAQDIEFEHALYFAGRRIQEIFAVVPVRMKYNRNPSAKVKGFNQYIALWRLQLSCYKYQIYIQGRYPKINFYKEFVQIEERFGFNLAEMPELKERLFKYRITKDAIKCQKVNF